MTNWKPYYKLDGQKQTCMAQQTYEPLISEDGKTFCKNYAYPNTYQLPEPRPLYTEEVVEWFWWNELQWIEFFQDRSYAPEILDIDYANRKIYIKWYDLSCNQIIYGGKSWPKDIWLSQIQDIILDQCASGVYKLTMYPHCHYIDNQGIMRAIDWYGCIDKNNPFVDAKYMDGIIHSTAKFRLEETGDLINNQYNLEIMFKRSLGTHVMWGSYTLGHVYKELFND